jgi:dTDP-glucose pyrophosphorylase
MFLITMAGASSRFFKMGYSLPKYMLPIRGQTVFDLAVCSFENYFSTDKFLFVVRDIFDTVAFVKERATSLGILDFEVIVLDKETQGQAETAFLGLANAHADEAFTVFNIDTFRYGYIKPEFLADCDGYLEVFKAEGEHWSFVEPGEDQNVLRTTEKVRISDLCSDGLYYFKSVGLFREIFTAARHSEDTVKGEYYIAPLYNRLIEQRKVVKYTTIELSEIDFCGTPDEYSALLPKDEPNSKFDGDKA